MKRIAASSCALFLATLSCAQTGPTGAGSSSGGSTATASGGRTSSSGGSTGSGGSNNSSSGGSTATGSGGSTSGTGGAVVAGGTTGSGGRGSGGATSSGGATGSGGAAGAGAIDITTLIPGLDGFFWEGTCSGNVTATGRNCPFSDDVVTTCPSAATYATRGAIKNRMLTVGGTTGTRYTVNFEVRGVAGTRCYTGGAPASTAAPNANGPNNTWYVGGTQFNDSIWNTYEIHVDPPVPGEANVYYANGFPMNPDWCQKEATYEIRYTARFAVLGGGTIRFTIHDANCQAQQNCGGDDTATVCNATRTVDVSGLLPAPTFTQPVTNVVGTRTYYPQWLYFDVKSVTSP